MIKRKTHHTKPKKTMHRMTISQALAWTELQRTERRR
jgi:hypothetical protein